MTSRVSNIRNILITPQRARISSGVPTSATATNNTLLSAKPDQIVMTSTRTAPGQQMLRFIFPFSPQSVSYRDLAPELSELQRPGKKPIVAFSKQRARRVDLEFLLAVPFDGMSIDIEDDLQLLEDMVASGRPVWFYNIDSFLASNNYVDGNYNPKFFWSIIDFSFQSVRRNKAQKITQANVVLSIIENGNPKIVPISLPRIQYTDQIPQNNPTVDPADRKEPPFIDFTTVAEINSNRKAAAQSQRG
jgi:hypothetical protein